MAHDSTVELIKPLLCEVIQAHSPSQLEHVDDILSRYEGREELIYRSICEKYGVAAKLPKERREHWWQGEPCSYPIIYLDDSSADDFKWSHGEEFSKKWRNHHKEESKRLRGKAVEAATDIFFWHTEHAQYLKDELDAAKTAAVEAKMSGEEQARRLRSEAHEASKNAANWKEKLNAATAETEEAKWFTYEQAKKLRSEANEASQEIATLKKERDAARKEAAVTKKSMRAEAGKLRSEVDEASEEAAFLQTELRAVMSAAEQKLSIEADAFFKRVVSLKEELDAAETEYAMSKKSGDEEKLHREVARLRSKGVKASKIVTELKSELLIARTESTETKKRSEVELGRLRTVAEEASKKVANLQGQLRIATRTQKDMNKPGEAEVVTLRSEAVAASKRAATLTEERDLARSEAAEAKMSIEAEAMRFRSEVFIASEKAACLQGELGAARRELATASIAEDDTESLRLRNHAANMDERLNAARMEALEARLSVDKANWLRREADEAFNKQVASLKEELKHARNETIESKRSGDEFARIRSKGNKASKLVTDLRTELNCVAQEAAEAKRSWWEETTRLHSEADEAANWKVKFNAAKKELGELKRSRQEEAKKLRSEEASLKEEFNAHRRDFFVEYKMLRRQVDDTYKPQLSHDDIRRIPPCDIRDGNSSAVENFPWWKQFRGGTSSVVEEVSYVDRECHP